MNNKYFLLRHGQTIYQAKGIDAFYPYLEDPPICLTKKGKKQIKKAAKKLKNRNIDLIYSSELFRTRQTSRIVAKELGLKVKFDKRLRDIYVGVFQGKQMKEYKQFFSTKKQRFSKRPPKGESWRDVKKRMKNVIESLEKKYKGKNILIISHADPLWLFSGVLKGLTEKKLLLKEYREDFWPNVGELLEVK